MMKAPTVTAASAVEAAGDNS